MMKVQIHRNKPLHCINTLKFAVRVLTRALQSILHQTLLPLAVLYAYQLLFGVNSIKNYAFKLYMEFFSIFFSQFSGF